MYSHRVLCTSLLSRETDELTETSALADTGVTDYGSTDQALPQFLGNVLHKIPKFP